MIVDGRSTRPPIKPPFEIPILSDSRAGDLDIIQSARKALIDPRIAAAVVYVNSPGGSATASKKIHASLSALSTAKPVVVCMASTAASGGYYVSSLGKQIFAQPSTITGSIGVVLGKIVLKDLLDRLSIGRETIIRGEGVSIYDSERPFSEREREKLLHQIERIYDAFLEVIVEAREIPKEELIEKADGKVWTGQQALENDLIDHLGSLEDAIAHAGELVDLPSRPRVQVMLPEKEWIPPVNPVQALVAHILDNFRHIQNQRILLISPFWHGNGDQPS
jgi:protease-4